ncbi:MAG: chorismate synthase [candidate division NC10 bacterium]|nr:chorismate synthase [candidate division NC10 bacterium]
MLGCDMGTLFKVAVAGGSYQEGMAVHVQGVPPGMRITEEEIYCDLLLRKPGQDELTSPRKEPDIPLIYSGINAADTMEGVQNRGLTNGTPFVILIPNLDRQLIHIEQYRRTNRTPRPGHASYASFQKYGDHDDAIGAGIFSGRYTCTIVAAGVLAKRILKEHGIEVCAYIKEAAGIRAAEMPWDVIREKVTAFRRVRRDHDPVYAAIYQSGRITPHMSFLEKMAVLSQLERILAESSVKALDERRIKEEYQVHPKLNCPDLGAAEEMYRRIIAIKEEGDSSGGVVEVFATGLPPGLGEPVFKKLDGELGRMLSIAAVKAVEIGAGVAVKDMTGSQCNDEMFIREGKVVFGSNHSGGITGGLTTGQTLIARLAVKPTPTIGKDQHTIDKVTLKEKVLQAVTRRDPTIVPRIWPVAEAFVAIVLLDHYMQHLAYQGLWRK